MVMLPVWFFVLVIGVICYLLYITKTTEDDILAMSRNEVNGLQDWMKENVPVKDLDR